MDLRPYLERLINKEELTQDEAYSIAIACTEGKLDNHQLAALLVLLAHTGETWNVVAGFALAMRQKCTLVRTSTPVAEIVGTGGDGFHTVNISTGAAILVAACDVPIAKHGNISVSSKSGSADVLKALNIALLPPSSILPCLEQANIAFMYAPLFHPAMKYVLPVRSSLKVRTIFNILGPLLNPALSTAMVLGVFTPRLLSVYARAVIALSKSEKEHIETNTSSSSSSDHGIRALIVHCCGMDEIAPIGVTQAIEVFPDGSMKEYSIDPLDFGIPRCSITDLQGGTPEENAIILRSLLEGKPYTLPHQTTSPATLPADTPLGQTLALNAGAVLYVYGKVASLKEGYQEAYQRLKTGEGGKQLEKWSQISQSL